jgi:glycosyltransferase involved in cell wall biosynthesis
MAVTPRPIRLFVDARWIAQPGQGVATYLEELYARLPVIAGEAIQIVYGVPRGIRPRFATDRTELFEYASDSFAWRMFALGHQLKKLNVDAAHFQYVLPWGMHRSIQTIVATHDVIYLDHPELFPLRYRLTRRYFMQASARRARAVVTLSEQSAASIQRHFQVPPARLHVIPLGVGSRLLGIPPIRPPHHLAERYLLAVGRHETRKNYARLVEAFNISGLYHERGIHLIIVGQPTDAFTVRKFPGEGVQYLGRCSDGELAWLYRNATAFVFPSIAEGYGLPAVEALEFGIPTLVANTYPIDAVRAKCAAVFDPLSVHSIATALCRVVRDTPSPSVEPPLPTWDDYAMRFLKILRSLIAVRT